MRISGMVPLPAGCLGEGRLILNSHGKDFVWQEGRGEEKGEKRKEIVPGRENVSESTS